MIRRSRAHASLALVFMLVVAACSTGGDDVIEQSGTVTGVVIAVDGTLGDVASFTVRMSDGTDATFEPIQGVLFDGTAPIDHVRDHLTSGSPVSIRYETLPDGSLSALEVGDG